MQRCSVFFLQVILAQKIRTADIGSSDFVLFKAQLPYGRSIVFIAVSDFVNSCEDFS